MLDKVGSEITKEFVKLGFTRREVEVYLVILDLGVSSAQVIAQILKVSPNSLYRMLDKLVRSKLVTISNAWPETYKAVPPSLGFDYLAKSKFLELEEAKEKIINLLPAPKDSDQTTIKIVGGVRELFSSYAKLSKKTKREILIISTGEEVPEEVLLANRDSLERGVNIRFIAHQFDESNKNLLIRWERMGVKVRHLPGKGFHLVVFDKNHALLSTSNLKNPKERTTIHIFSQPLSKALSDYFSSVWKKASPIS
jgi:sugar-specific transcriptional regulator TrmB